MAVASERHLVPAHSNTAYIPEYREAFGHAGDVLTERCRCLRRTERVVRHVLERLKLNIYADLLLGLQIRCLEPILTKRLDLRIVRPAKPGALSITAQRQVARRGEKVQAGEAGAEHVPA